MANNSAIKGRVYKDLTKPHNKIANGYASYITDTLVGYFMGKPITYNYPDDGVLEYLNQTFEYNDEADENMELAKSASIYGVAYEQLYMDEDGVLRFKTLPTMECIPVYDTTIENNLLYFIRYYEDCDILTDEVTVRIDVIDSERTVSYVADQLLSGLTMVDEVPHYFKMVPIAVFKNNEEEVGDFERVIDIIDAYDKMQSDNLNDFEYFVDAYLALYGYNADGESVAQMKRDRVLLMDEGTSAEFLTKTTSDTYIENMKNRLDNDIHKFSFCPNMSDEAFASNASGIAIKFKTLGTENLTATKERKFKRGLQQRFELMSTVTAMLGTTFDWRELEIIFTRNLPTNDNDVATMVNTLKDIVSTETLLAQIPFVTDVPAELERLKKEKEEAKEENPFFQSIQSYSEGVNSRNELESDSDEPAEN